LSQNSIDFQQLTRDLLSRANYLVPSWLPGGKLQGREYQCADFSGRPGKSLSVNIDNGKWADFATGDAGGDLISLYAAIKGVGQVEAAKDLVGEQDLPTVPRSVYDAKPKPKPESVVPQVVDHKPKELKNFDLVHTYTTKKNEPWFYIGRKGTGKGKIVKPFVYYKHPELGEGWHSKQPKPVKPLFNLGHIYKNKTAPILICEGEKACEATRKFQQAYIATTPLGGSSAVRYADLEPLYKRNILIWPDNDEAGVKFKDNLVELLQGKVKSLKYLEVSDLGESEDAADVKFKSQGEFVAWAKSRVIEVPIKKANPVEPMQEMPKPPQPQRVERIERPEDDGPPPAPPLESYEPEGTLIREEPGVTNVMNVYSDDATEDLVPMAMATKDKMSLLGFTMRTATKPDTNEFNILKVLNRTKEFKDRFWFDTFHSKGFTTWLSPDGRPEPLAQKHFLTLLEILQSEYRMGSITYNKVESTLMMQARRIERSEPKEWLDSLEWDGKPRMDTFFQDVYSCPMDPEYLKTVSNNFMVGLVARIYQPGVKMDNMVVLEGGQGIKKSTSIEALVGESYFVQIDTSPEDKDSLMALTGRMIVEIEEMHSFTKSDSSKNKAFLSRRIDSFRVPYGREIEDRPRQSIFIGTTNDKKYLDDHTGSRRYYPVECDTEVNLEFVKENRVQLFAEAVTRYKAGAIWYEEPKGQKEINSRRDKGDDWRSWIEEYIEGKVLLSRREVFTEALDLTKRDVNSQARNRVNAVFQSLGYVQAEKKSVWYNGKNCSDVYYNRNKFGHIDEALEVFKGYTQQKLDERTKMPEGRKNYAPGFEHTLK